MPLAVKPSKEAFIVREEIRIGIGGTVNPFSPSAGSKSLNAICGDQLFSSNGTIIGTPQAFQFVSEKFELEVLLLDEPFGALDANVRRELRRWLRLLHDEMGATLAAARTPGQPSRFQSLALQ